MNKILKLILSDNTDAIELGKEFLRENPRLLQDFKILCKYQGVRNNSRENHTPEIWEIDPDSSLYWRIKDFLTEKEHRKLSAMDAQVAGGKYYRDTLRILKKLMRE